MKNTIHTSPPLATAVWVLVALALSALGCASGETEFPGEGGTASTGGNTSTGGTISTGGGGSGGGTTTTTSLCDQDCSLIDTQNQCLQAVCNEGQYPGEVGSCVVVDVANGDPCDDGLFCTGQNQPGETAGDSCQDGQCTAGNQNICGQIPSTCEAVTCSESGQDCSTAPANEGADCNDVQPCQVNGHCTNGLCVGTQKDCTFSPYSECNVVACNPNTNQCEPTAADPSKQGQACALTGDLCSDGKTCNNGLCEGGSAKDCSYLTVNCTNGVCNPNNGFCEADPVPPGGTCYDGIGECEEGTCDNNANCVPSNLPSGTSCDDFNSCTTGDVCDGSGQCAGTNTPNCTTYFEELFEGGCPPGGWTLNPDWQCGVPTSGPGSAYSGSQCLATVLAGNYANNLAWASAYSQTPPIDLSAAAEPLLSFWAWYNTESCCDGWHVEISTDNGATFSLVTTVTPAYNGTVNSQQAWRGNLSASGWQPFLVDLLAYQGQTVILRFAFRSDGSVVNPGVYIDDVRVSEAASVPLTITTANPLPDAPADAAYSHFMAKSGGSSSSEWTIVGGSNHTWLTIDTNTGELTGTPLAANIGPVTVTIHVEEPADPNNFDELTFDLDVTPLTITTANPLPVAYENNPYSVILTKLNGGPTPQWSITGGSNHTWLTIDPNTGQLSGTPLPANVGPATVTVRVEEASDLANFDEVTFDLDVVAVIWFEGFEGACPNGWTLGGDWQCGTPSSGPGSAYTGSQCLATQLAGNYNTSQAWLTATASSPAIDLTLASNPVLSWRVWLHTEGSIYDGTNLKVSTNGGATYQLVTTVTPAYTLTIDSQQCWGGNQSALGWQLFSADLSAYAGQTVRIQFGFRTDTSVQYPGVYIDEVVIAD